MKRWTAMTAVVFMVCVGCGPPAATVGRGRQGSWQRVADPGFTAGATHTITGLAAPGDGYPAWAAAGSMRSNGSGDTEAAVWSSPDGTRWTRAPLDRGAARDTEASGAAVHSGVAVVVGTASTAAGARDARIWTSHDGAAWAPVPLPAAAGDRSLTSVGAGPLGFVAAGTSDGKPILWWSQDGGAWHPVDGPFQAGQAIEGVAVGPKGAVAVGTLDTGGEVDGMAWFSADGTSWRTVPLGSADGIAWQRQAPSPDMDELPGLFSTGGVTAAAVAGSGPFVAVGGGFGAQVWTSPDGRRWARTDAPAAPAKMDTAFVATDGQAQLVFVSGKGLFVRPSGGVTTDSSYSRWADR